MDIEVSRNLSHVQRELTIHSTILSANAESMKNLSHRSDERLDYIRERFDGLENGLSTFTEVMDAKIVALKEERNRLLIGAVSLFTALCTAVWFTIVVPLNVEIVTLREKVDAVEKRVSWDHTHGPAE
jgi:hypothetical protein